MYPQQTNLKLGGKKLKNTIHDLLNSDNWKQDIVSLVDSYGAKLTNSFFSASYSEDKLVSSRAIYCFGILTEKISVFERDKIRILMRKCIWMLTEESGGIPWRIPEIMGQIMSADKLIAEDYCDILFSYINEVESGPENFLEHLPIRISVYKGINLLSRKFPHLIAQKKVILEQRFQKEIDPETIAYLSMIISNSNLISFKEHLKKYVNDNTPIEYYSEDMLINSSLAQIIKESLDNLSN
jgi:hypothetical protein